MLVKKNYIFQEEELQPLSLGQTSIIWQDTAMKMKEIGPNGGSIPGVPFLGFAKAAINHKKQL